MSMPAATIAPAVTPRTRGVFDTFANEGQPVLGPDGTQYQAVESLHAGLVPQNNAILLALWRLSGMVS